jgi:hypothetical protein
VGVEHRALQALGERVSLGPRRDLGRPQRQFRVPAWIAPRGKQPVERAASKEDPRTHPEGPRLRRSSWTGRTASMR